MTEPTARQLGNLQEEEARLTEQIEALELTRDVVRERIASFDGVSTAASAGAAEGTGGALSPGGHDDDPPGGN